jgi:DNA-binding phage protein
MNLEPTAEEAAILAGVRRVLTAQFRVRGHGTRTEVLEKIGMSQSALDMAFSRGSLKFVQLLRILKALDLDPGRFLHAAIPPESMQPLPETLPPKEVRLGMKRRRKAKAARR